MRNPGLHIGPSRALCLHLERHREERDIINPVLLALLSYAIILPTKGPPQCPTPSLSFGHLPKREA
jgi:hypothetical protein